MEPDCGWLCTFLSIVGLYIVYKLVDRILRIPDIGHYGDRYILVTGCDTGFGHDLAKRLDSLGCHVFAGCLTEKGETELKKTCSSRLHPISMDVTKPDSVRKAFDVVTSKLPAGKGLWGVVNNAGILGPLGQIEWLHVDDIKNTLDVNLHGVIDVTMTFLPLIKKSRGRVVNMTSIAGRITVKEGLSYCISKYGAEAFTDGLRRSLRPYGCKACLIEPGFHHTGFITTGNLTSAFERTWNNAAPEAREEFGEDYYKTLTAKFIDTRGKLMVTTVTGVIDAYQHALLGRWPRARYVVGLDAKLVFLPLAALPEWIGDWIQERMDSLPLPAALQKR